MASNKCKYHINKKVYEISDTDLYLHEPAFDEQEWHGEVVEERRADNENQEHIGNTSWYLCYNYVYE